MTSASRVRLRRTPADGTHESVPRYGLLIRRLLLQTLTNRTIVRTRAGSTVAYVRSRRVFSSASRFSKPMSHAIPNGRPGEGRSESLMMGT
jgi:hypothetical protein